MDPTAESKNPNLDPQDPKNFCYTCNKKLKVVLINRRQQCKKCKKENPQPRPEPKPRSRFPWEDYGFETIWDINQETGIAEERVVFEDGKFPNTAEFWHDLWIAQQAFESKDTNFKHFLLEMMRIKNKNDIPREMLYRVFGQRQERRELEEQQQREEQEAGRLQTPRRQLLLDAGDATMEPGPNFDLSTTPSKSTFRGLVFPPAPISLRVPLTLPSTSPSTNTSSTHRPLPTSTQTSYLPPWDHLLSQILPFQKRMHKTRLFKLHVCHRVAKWAVWNTQTRRESRGEFVEDREGMWPWKICAPGFGVDGERVVKVMDLGYTRTSRRREGRGRMEGDEVIVEDNGDGDGDVEMD